MAEINVPFAINRCDPMHREPGAMFFTTRPGSIHNQKAQMGWVMGFDRDGQQILNVESNAATQDIRYHPGGTIFYSQAGAGRIVEIDLYGRELRCWHARGRWQGKTLPKSSIELPVDVLHHTFTFMPNGNFLMLSAELRTIENWYTSTTDKNATRATARVVGDVICEVSLDGELVNEWRLFDMLDPYRISHGSLSGYWNKQGFPDSHDWSHANAVAFNAEDQSVLVSLRHQDCLLNFDYSTGALRWILGNHGNWSDRYRDLLLAPEDGLVWQYHQHDCSFVGTNRVLCFDNGNFRAPAFSRPMEESASYSRVVEFEIDVARRKVKEVWRYGGPSENQIFACYQGGALRLPSTGNTFMTFGGICFKDGRPTRENGAGAFGKARLMEVTRDGRVVFDLSIDDSRSAAPAAFSAFRSEHVPIS